MATFDDRLWDGSDPLYMPCTGLSSGLFYWKPLAKYRKAGYAAKPVRLEGRYGDGRDLERAAKARELTRDMLRWYEGNDRRLTPGTWGELIARYKSDDVSPFQDVEPNTRESYLVEIKYWEPVIGQALVTDMTFAEAKTIVKAMQAKGRSAHFISTRFGALRRFANYGRALRFAGADDASTILGQLRLQSPRPRSAAPTEAQIMAVIAAADQAGDTSFALGLLIQWRLSLRAMDVRGDYFRLTPGEDRSGICRGQFRWGKGLTWDMIDRDCATLSKAPSKTIASAPDVIQWDLTLTPDLRARLQAVPTEKRLGPVITDRQGMPYDRFLWGDIWRKHRKAAGVPESILMMDTRAGAINDAKNKGATQIQMQQQATHASPQTTDRYIREVSAGVNNVLRIRQERS